MLMETRKKISVFLLSSEISSLVKMRDREMITPAVPERESTRRAGEGRVKKWLRTEEKKTEKERVEEMRMRVGMCVCN